MRRNQLIVVLVLAGLGSGGCFKLLGQWESCNIAGIVRAVVPHKDGSIRARIGRPSDTRIWVSKDGCRTFKLAAPAGSYPVPGASTNRAGQPLHLGPTDYLHIVEDAQDGVAYRTARISSGVAGTRQTRDIECPALFVRSLAVMDGYVYCAGAGIPIIGKSVWRIPKASLLAVQDQASALGAPRAQYAGAGVAILLGLLGLVLPYRFSVFRIANKGLDARFQLMSPDSQRLVIRTISFLFIFVGVLVCILTPILGPMPW